MELYFQSMEMQNISDTFCAWTKKECQPEVNLMHGDKKVEGTTSLIAPLLPHQYKHTNNVPCCYYTIKME